MSKRKPKATIDPNRIKIRDYLLLALIRGATKSGIQRDHRKELARKACRKPPKEE